VRYYVQRGLLPAPQFRGRDTAYGAHHLLILRAIKKLQEGFLPLDAIQAELAQRSAEDILALPPPKTAIGSGSHSPPPELPHPYRFPGRAQQPHWHVDLPQRERMTRVPLLEGVDLLMTEAAERDPATRAFVAEVEALAKKGGT